MREHGPHRDGIFRIPYLLVNTNIVSIRWQICNGRSMARASTDNLQAPVLLDRHNHGEDLFAGYQHIIPQMQRDGATYARELFRANMMH